jgi:alkylated DNA repair dioxygenase AlkB
MNAEVLLSTETAQLLRYEDLHLQHLMDRVEAQVADLKAQLVHDPSFTIGKMRCVSHRAVGFFSDEVKEYNYSNTHTPALPMTDPLRAVLEQVNAKLGTRFNGVLVNWYRDGRDSIGMHSDKELELDPSGQVAMFCVGAERVMKFQRRDVSATTDEPPAAKRRRLETIHRIVTQPRYLYCMTGTFQKEFKHGIDPDKTVTQERLSFTFRCHRRKQR